MPYTRKDIIKKCDEAMADPSTFYQAPVVNYRGRTDKGELYNEIVAEYVFNHIDELKKGIKKIIRESYKTEGHDGVIKSGKKNSNRVEEHIAADMFNQCKMESLDFIGKIIDYQTPLKNRLDDENKGVGKIDLLSFDGKTLYIAELKKPDSKETMLRCVLEGYTYLKIVNEANLIESFKLPKGTDVVACPLVFSGGSQNNEMNEDRPWLKKVMEALGSKPYYITEDNGRYSVTDKGKPRKEKELNRLLDLAVMAEETVKNPALKAGYSVVGREKPYANYIENKCWDEFKQEMESQYPTAFAMYGQGGGKELDERRVGRYICPPKMASFGSSSRMIFNLLKDKEKEGFRFEQKLPTTVGGVANLDGYMMTDDRCVFVEAKCREPYSAKNSVIDRKYEKLYEFISASSGTKLVCGIEDLPDENENEKKMKVTFSWDGKEIRHFDIKQMICHLLGIATAYLNGTVGDDGEATDNRRIEFIYLLFNPKLIDINEGKDEIHSIYDATCKECNAIDFRALFGVVTEFLTGCAQWKNQAEASRFVSGFSFELKDQDTVKKSI